MTEAQEPVCKICNTSRSEHNFRHPFDDGTSDVVLPEKHTKSKKDRENANVDARIKQAMASVSGPVVRLASVLLEKGVISAVDMEFVLTGRGRDENYADPASRGIAHVAGGEGETSERGVRDSAGPSTPGDLHHRAPEQVSEPS